MLKKLKNKILKLFFDKVQLSENESYILIKSDKEKQKTLINSEPFYYREIYKTNFKFSKTPKLGVNFFIDLKDNSRIEFTGAVIARGNFSVIGRENGRIEIGEKVFFNLGCSISCIENITIGNNVLFGEGVKIYDHNHQFKNPDELIRKQGMTKGKVEIGNNCWIGSNVVILKNVRIGENAVIGTGCVIYKDVPANSTVINHQNLNTILRG